MSRAFRIFGGILAKTTDIPQPFIIGMYTRSKDRRIWDILLSFITVLRLICQYRKKASCFGRYPVPSPARLWAIPLV